MAAKTMPTQRGVHGRSALSQATRRRLLKQLLAAAEGGDHRAAAELVWLGMRAESLPKARQVEVAPA